MVQWIGFSDDDGYVKKPRCWNPKTTLSLCVASTFGYRNSFAVVAKYITDADGKPRDSVFRDFVTNQLCKEVEASAQRAWSRITSHVDISRRAAR